MKAKSFLLYAVICFLLIAGFQSCKKSTQQPFDNFPRATQTIKYLTQAAWKETTLEYEYQNGTWVQLPLSNTVTSEKNVFNTDGTYVVYNYDGSVNTNGVYDLMGDYTQLALNKSITYDITVLDNNTLQLSLTGQIPYTNPSTGTVTTYYGMRQTFAH